MARSNDGSRRPATQLVHGATMRSQFNEMSEALFLTQGYAYESMEVAEERFKGTSPGFIYSRYGNPTVSMFEERMAMLEGAEAARATASGMAAVTAALMGQVRAGDHVVAAKALFGSCLYVVEDLLPRFGVASTLVDGSDLDQWRAAMRPQTKVCFMESPTNPSLEVYDIAGGRGDRPSRRRDAGDRQRIRDAHAAASAGARRRRRHLFGDQARRRAWPLPRRHRAVQPGADGPAFPQLSPADRPFALAVQRLGHAEIAGKPAGARRPPVHERGPRRRLPGRSPRHRAGHLSRPGGPSRRRRWSRGR